MWAQLDRGGFLVHRNRVAARTPGLRTLALAWMRALGKAWAPFAVAAACLALVACGAGKGGESSSHAATGGGIQSGPTVGTGTTARPAAAKLVADPEEAKSFPAPASTHHAAAATPAKAGEAVVAAGAPSDAEVKAELQQMQAVEQSAKKARHAHLDAGAGRRVDRR